MLGEVAGQVHGSRSQSGSGRVILPHRLGTARGRGEIDFSPGRSTIERDFEHRLAALYANAETPRLSGVQIKAPMCLEADGRLSPSVGTSFTPILKPAGSSGFEALPVIEWIGLSLARAIGLPAPEGQGRGVRPEEVPCVVTP
ncbi:hypothetical protein ABXN37_21900 [Piscinibacter sakaiensis]|uniref:hypothetical protein n=1 Tax=Piscinibacter sakaiensis TaxID=1547922 RepID=UPI003726E020